MAPTCRFFGTRFKKGLAPCGEPAPCQAGKRPLCKKHYRFIRMRAGASHWHRTVPSFAELERLLQEYGMVCPGCSRTMNWLQEEGKATQLTLQHDRSGEIRFLCLSCNTRHAFRPGDDFYNEPKDKRCCRRCKAWKSLEEFQRSRRRWQGRCSLCKACARLLHREWRSSHREHQRLYRQRYAARKRAERQEAK